LSPERKVMGKLHGEKHQISGPVAPPKTKGSPPRSLLTGALSATVDTSSRYQGIASFLLKIFHDKKRGWRRPGEPKKDRAERHAGLRELLWGISNKKLLFHITPL
jgi:hypothetical protein